MFQSFQKKYYGQTHLVQSRPISERKEGPLYTINTTLYLHNKKCRQQSEKTSHMYFVILSSDMTQNFNTDIKPLSTKLYHLKTQFVPGRKHSLPRL